jgi:uncharacterized protein YebE (UPF0316 family)
MRVLDAEGALPPGDLWDHIGSGAIITCGQEDARPVIQSIGIESMEGLFSPGPPVWALAILIFLLRVADVSLGTMRTIVVVHGRVRLSVALGFVEVLIWITAVSQVILRLRESPVLILAYAAGFAAGNAVGIVLERRLALGQCVVRMISREGEGVSRALSSLGRVRGVFRSETDSPSTQLVFATLARSDLPEAVRRVKALDPEVFHVVDRFSQTNGRTPLPRATGWRAILKMK